MGEGLVTLFLCGDVMLGRGVDQILPHPGDPVLREVSVRDARDYVALAEAASGAIPQPVDVAWPWGAALEVLRDAAPDVRVVNLETSVTRGGTFAPGKGVHYRMSPDNLACLAVARPDVCVLANNHVLDFGRRGLADTLDALAGAGLRVAGAGRDAAAARQPVTVPLGTRGRTTGTHPRVDGAPPPAGDGPAASAGTGQRGRSRRVLVLASGLVTSGIPPDWTATGRRSGVDVLARPSEAAAAALAGRLRRAKRPGDIAVVSLHWGANWDHDVSPADVRFAHALVDAGADIVHAHSSHHPRPVEVYRDRLVLYGCGDLIDDYEGISGHEQYRHDLRVLYLVSVEADTGRLARARMVPLRARRMRLEHASPQDAEWLRTALDGTDRGLGPHVERAPDGTLTLAHVT